MAEVYNFTIMMAVGKKLSSRELFFHKNVQRGGKGLQMMMYSASSSDSYRVCVISCMCDIMSVRSSMGKLLQAAVHTGFQCCALSSGFFFCAQAKGIKFYDLPLVYVKEEFRFRCELEPFNMGMPTAFV